MVFSLPAFGSFIVFILGFVFIHTIFEKVEKRVIPRTKLDYIKSANRWILFRDRAVRISKLIFSIIGGLISILIMTFMVAQLSPENQLIYWIIMMLFGAVIIAILLRIIRKI